ncbi:MAG: DUF1816 domain-containing protein [Microcoleaceae cyanobacterium]
MSQSVINHCPWWIKIQTTIPQCTYYFGPFSSQAEAQTYKAGYLEDLTMEQAEGIVTNLEQSQPQNLTIFEEE